MLALVFGLILGPVAWALHLLINYAMAGQRCTGAATEATTLSPGGAMPAMLLIDLGALVLAVAAGCVAFKLWKNTKDEKAGDALKLVHAGEGRTRFLSMCGMLTSLLFALAIAVDALGSIVGPPC